MSETHACTPKYTIHDGFRMPMGFPVAGFSSGLRYSPHASDIFVSTYPKCGTTWMQYIVYLIVNEGRAMPPGRNIGDVFPHLEETGAQAVEALPAPRLIKTHLQFSMVPYRPETKYIYVARNPFDCAVSFFHHTRGFVKHYDFAHGTFDDFFECFLAGEVDFGDYFDHLIPWHAHRDDENLLFVTYEDMQADPEGAILAVGDFLGGAYRETVHDRKLLRVIREASSFDSMRSEQRRWSSERPPGMPEFVRRGVVGDWRNHFSADQARRLTEKFARRTAQQGVFGLWPETLAEAVRFGSAAPESLKTLEEK